MNRRAFARNTAAALLAGSVCSPMAAGPVSQTTAARREAPFALSVMLWTVFRDLPFEQRLEKVAEAGYTNVELVGEYEKWSQPEFERANAKRKQLGISFDTTAGLEHGLCNPHDRPALLRELRQALVAMEKLECPSIILLSGDVVPGMSRTAQRQSCIDGLKACAELIDDRAIAGKKVRLLLENIDPEENPHYFLTSSAEGFQIVRTVNHPQVQSLYDLFHEQIAEGNLLKKLEQNIGLIGTIHVADVPGRHEPGTGEINYEVIFRRLFELRYQGVVAMEFLPTSDPVHSLRAARQMAVNAGATTSRGA